MRSATRSIALVLAVAFVLVPAFGVRAEEGTVSTDAQATDQTQSDAPPEFAGPSQRQQKEPSPEEMQKMMGAMLTPMADMMGLMLEGMAKTMAKKEIAEYFATFTRNYFDALIARGFTEEQALKIVTASGIPSMGGKQ